MRGQRLRAFLLCLSSLVVGLVAFGCFVLMGIWTLVSPNDREIEPAAYVWMVAFVLVAGTAYKLWTLGRDAGRDFDPRSDEQIVDGLGWLGVFLVWVALPVGVVVVVAVNWL